jgi:hypothetical protein
MLCHTSEVAQVYEQDLQLFTIINHPLFIYWPIWQENPDHSSWMLAFTGFSSLVSYGGDRPPNCASLHR